MKVQFNDLYAQYQTIKDGVDGAIKEVIEESAYIKSKHVSLFEENFANAVSSKACIGCANGTDTLEIALKSLKISVDDEVLVPASTWISTAEAVTSVGAKVVFVDVDPQLYTIDVKLIESKITKKTKAIIPVHFYGLPAEMDKILELANKYNLKIIEDCAQAHLATYKDRIVGSIGDVGSFSFFPGKNLGAYGDAGGITTNDEQIADFCRKYANHGRIGKHDHEFEGRNSRLDGLQAAILNVKLPYLKEWTKKRQAIARMYSEYLKGSDIQIPTVPEHSTHVFHLYVVQVKNRDKVQNFLSQKGIQTGIHYPIALPFTEAYSYLGHAPEDFPVSYNMMSKILSLPIYPEMTGEQVEYVAKTLISSL